MALGLAPVRRVSLAAEVAERLRESIIRGDLAAGAAIPEAQTAQQLGVSRVPVREALVELERDGLISFDARGRAVVRALTDDDCLELVTLRAPLEALAFRLATQKITAQDVWALEELIAQTGRATDVRELSRLDIAFHDEIVRIARHRRLSDCWRGLRSQLELWLASCHRRWEGTRHDTAETTARTHTAALRMLERRDPDAAARLGEANVNAWFNYKDFWPSAFARDGK